MTSRVNDTHYIKVTCIFKNVLDTLYLYHYIYLYIVATIHTDCVFIKHAGGTSKVVCSQSKLFGFQQEISLVTFIQISVALFMNAPKLTLDIFYLRNTSVSGFFCLIHHKEGLFKTLSHQIITSYQIQ